MGTRNLTMVVKGGQFKVAQYGQWDGYPEGQGATVYEFLASPDFDLDLFRQRVEQCRFGTDAEIEAAFANFSTGGGMNMEQAERFKASEFGYLSRDTGAKILALIAASPEGLLLQDSHEFAKESLFCEWAYLIDLDANEPTLEVYRGFQKAPLDPNDRFYDLSPSDAEVAAFKPRYEGDSLYYPVRKVWSSPINNLPASLSAFVASVEETEPKEEEDA